VHFIFNPTGAKPKISLFTRNLTKFIELNDEELADFDK